MSTVLVLPASRPLHAAEGAAAFAEAALPSLAPLVKRVAPAVVAVTSSRRPPGWFAIDPGAGFPDAPLPQELQVAGAGVIVNARLGLIMTSNHVVENAEAISVALADGRHFDATMVAHSDHDDLAVLRITPSDLTAVGLGDAKGVEVGDFVLALGNPLGGGQTTTFGIVSALHRSCPGIDNSDLVVTDALIERGNSGGPLLNLRGELVGIMVARAGDSDGAGFGFAIPLGTIRELLATIAIERLSAVH
ncbi:MAG TPA: trypsin-like peptidase domain-containing protein [Bradyrhizobium sp.]|nr:trypsin-like peptidase domain-containing protein [Bradyrhizobium sp.]